MTGTTANPFDSSSILDGIRRWVEIETPTEVPLQVNRLADFLLTEEGKPFYADGDAA